MHRNDDDEDCNCYKQECGYDDEGEVVCPICGSYDITLNCGDHGCSCDTCGETFTCP